MTRDAVFIFGDISGRRCPQLSGRAGIREDPAEDSVNSNRIQRLHIFFMFI